MQVEHLIPRFSDFLVQYGSPAASRRAGEVFRVYGFIRLGFVQMITKYEFLLKSGDGELACTKCGHVCIVSLRWRIQMNYENFCCEKIINAHYRNLRFVCFQRSRLGSYGYKQASILTTSFKFLRAMSLGLDIPNSLRSTASPTRRSWMRFKNSGNTANRILYRLQCSKIM